MTPRAHMPPAKRAPLIRLLVLLGMALPVVAALAWLSAASPPAAELPARHFNTDNLARLATLKKNPVTFAVFGDSRDHSGAFPVLLKAVRREAEMDFAIHLGDLVSTGKLAEYAAFFQEIQTLADLPVLAVVGNHELGGDGPHLFREIFGPTYYSFRLADTAFIMLNNAAKEGITESEWNWLREELEKARSAARRLVFLHVPLYDPRPDREKPHAMPAPAARRLLALFKEHQVNHVFAGHIHGYFTGDWDGLPYTISGGAGTRLHGRDPQHYFHHYLKVRLDLDRLTVEVKPLPAVGKERP